MRVTYSRCANGRVDGRVDVHADERAYECPNEHEDGHANEHIDGRVEKHANGHIDERAGMLVDTTCRHVNWGVEMLTKVNECNLWWICWEEQHISTSGVPFIQSSKEFNQEEFDQERREKL